MENNTYKIKVACNNCDFKGEIDILKGNPIERTPCPNCGTRRLSKEGAPPTTSTYYRVRH